VFIRLLMVFTFLMTFYFGITSKGLSSEGNVGWFILFLVIHTLIYPLIIWVRKIKGGEEIAITKDFE